MRNTISEIDPRRQNIIDNNNTSKAQKNIDNNLEKLNQIYQTLFDEFQEQNKPLVKIEEAQYILYNENLTKKDLLEFTITEFKEYLLSFANQEKSKEFKNYIEVNLTSKDTIKLYEDFVTQQISKNFNKYIKTFITKKTYIMTITLLSLLGMSITYINKLN